MHIRATLLPASLAPKPSATFSTSPLVCTKQPSTLPFPCHVQCLAFGLFDRDPGLPPQALEQLSDKALPEWAAFAATLARRMAELLPLHQVALADPVWKACVDRFLLKAVDIDSQVEALCSCGVLCAGCMNICMTHASLLLSLCVKLCFQVFISTRLGSWV